MNCRDFAVIFTKCAVIFTIFLPWFSTVPTTALSDKVHWLCNSRHFSCCWWFMNWCSSLPKFTGKKIHQIVSLKIWRLVATILTILLRINWPVYQKKFLSKKSGVKIPCLTPGKKISGGGYLTPDPPVPAPPQPYSGFSALSLISLWTLASNTDDTETSIHPDRQTERDRETVRERVSSLVEGSSTLQHRLEVERLKCSTVAFIELALKFHPAH